MVSNFDLFYNRSRAWKENRVKSLKTEEQCKVLCSSTAFKRLLGKLGVEHAWATALQQRFYPENCGKATAMSEFLEAERARASFVEGSVWLHNEYNSTVFPQSPCSPWCIAHGGYFGDRVTSWSLTSRNNEKRWDLGYSRTDIFPWWWPETHLAAREDWSLGRISGLMQARIIIFLIIIEWSRYIIYHFDSFWFCISDQWQGCWLCQITTVAITLLPRIQSSQTPTCALSAVFVISDGAHAL